MTVFNKHAPLKTKYVRANGGPFMTKDPRKAMTLRSNLRNKLNKNKTLEANLAYKRQKFVHFSCEESQKGILC